LLKQRTMHIFPVEAGFGISHLPEYIWIDV